jgi:hypothetical protein
MPAAPAAEVAGSAVGCAVAGGSNVVGGPAEAEGVTAGDALAHRVRPEPVGRRALLICSAKPPADAGTSRPSGPR